MADLISLPAELISLIADFTSPCSHFAFACTCRYALACLRDVLKRHEWACDQHYICSDVSSDEVPSLLRLILVDPIVAWHVRDVQWWENRKYWTNWIFKIDDPNDDRAQLQDAKPLRWDYREDEIAHYLDIMQEHTKDLRHGREKARDVLLRGDDGLLKVLILLLCPRLQSVKYISNDYTAMRDDGELLINTSIPLLLDVIKFYRHKEAHLWPVGLQALKHLAIGVESGTWIDEELALEQSPGDLANLLCLPALESIFFRGLGSRNLVQDSEHWRSILKPGCSTVRKIFLDEMSDMTSSFWRGVMRACKNQLTDVAFRSSTLFGFDRYIADAQDIVPNLQSLMIYDPQPDYLPGHEDRYYNLNDLHGFDSASGRGLRQVTTTTWDIACAALELCWEEVHLRFRDSFVRFFASLRPGYASVSSSMEVLVINGDFHRASRVCGVDIEELATYFDEGLAAMINSVVKPEPADEQSNSSNETSYLYPKLKAIVIEPWASHELDPWKTHLWFQKAIKAGIERGVDFRTRTNVNPPIHPDIDYHSPPDPKCLHSPLRDEAFGNSQVFDPFTGRWKVKGCGNCAKCHDCLALFPKTMWETAYRAPEKPASA